MSLDDLIANSVHSPQKNSNDIQFWVQLNDNSTDSNETATDDSGSDTTTETNTSTDSNSTTGTDSNATASSGSNATAGSEANSTSGSSSNSSSNSTSLKKDKVVKKEKKEKVDLSSPKDVKPYYQATPTAHTDPARGSKKPRVGQEDVAPTAAYRPTPSKEDKENKPFTPRPLKHQINYETVDAKKP